MDFSFFEASDISLVVLPSLLHFYVGGQSQRRLFFEGRDVTSRLFPGTVGCMVYFESSLHLNSCTISSPIF